MSGSKAWQRNSHASLPPPPPPHASALARLTRHKAAVTANSYKHIYIIPTRMYYQPTAPVTGRGGNLVPVVI